MQRHVEIRESAQSGWLMQIAASFTITAPASGRYG
jgi:hypothetical protein